MTTVVIRALLEMLVADPTVTTAGIVDVNPWAPGIDLAGRLDLPIATDFRELVADPRVDPVIDVTGDAQAHQARSWRIVTRWSCASSGRNRKPTSSWARIRRCARSPS